MRPGQIVICMDYANRYTHWQQDGATCKHDRLSSHLVAFVLTHPTYATSAKITKTGHRCEAWSFWNEDPKQTPECIHASLNKIIKTEQSKAAARGVVIKEIIIFSDRCGEQNSGRKNFRMCSESAAAWKLLLLWMFACPHHFAGVWDAWGGSEARLLKNVEKAGKDTMRTVIDCVLKLRHLRQDLINQANAVSPAVVHPAQNDDDSDDSDSDDSDSDESGVDQDSEEEGEEASEHNTKTNYKVSGCHVELLQWCKCRSAGSCTCVPDPRVPDTIFYRRDPRYEAEVIKGCASMYAYRFLPNLKYVVDIRQFTCETCPGCNANRPDDVRYTGCVNLSTVRATSYKCSGHKGKLASARCRKTGWVRHKIRPIVTTAVAGTRATDGLNRVDFRSRLTYVAGLRAGDNVMMANTQDYVTGELRARHCWIAELLSPPEGSAVVWKTKKALPPDCPAGSYCCKIQWYQRTSRDGRLFKRASAQYISLTCIVPVDYKIVLDQKNSSLHEIVEELQSKILITLGNLVIDD